MAGIRHLKDVYEKKGKAFLNKLLNDYVIVNEKVNGNHFGFKKNRSDDTFKFFNKRNEISYIDRVLSRLYNQPISHLTSLTEKEVQRIPSNLYFGFEYIPHTDVAVEEYGRLPKNGLILNFIHQLDENGDVEKTIQTKEQLDKWADILNVNGPTIVFEGNLNDDQKNEIQDFIYSPEKDLLEKFKTTSLIKHIVSVLNPQLKESFLENSIVKDTNGLVFRFYDENIEDPDGMVFLAKVIDPIFKKMSEERQGSENSNKAEDYTWLIVSDLMNFIESYDLKTISNWKIHGDTYEERYIKFINKVFKDFIDRFKNKYEGLELNKPDFLNDETFNLNMDLIEDPYVLDLIKSSDTYKEIYKILLNFFRKKRKKSNSPFFNKKMIGQLNLIVDKIKKMLFKEEVFEGFFPTFNEYVGESGEFTPLTIDGFSKNKKAIEKPKKVNLLVGKFQPLHLGHIKAIEKLKSKNNLPTVIVSIIKDSRNKTNPFSESQIKSILNKVEQEYGDLIEKIIVVKRGSFDEILGSLKPRYIPILWGTGKKQLNNHALQLNYLKKKHPSLDLNKDFKLVEIPKYQSSSDLRNIIRDENFSEFKRLVPQSISSEFYNLKREMDESLNESTTSDIED
jgi:cytidyltransferase-like protein